MTGFLQTAGRAACRGGWLGLLVPWAMPFALPAEPVYFLHEGALIQFEGEEGHGKKLAPPSSGVAISEFMGVLEGNRPLVKLQHGDDAAGHGHEHTHDADPSVADIAILGPDGQVQEILAEDAVRAHPSPSGRRLALIDSDYSIHVLEEDGFRLLDIPERTVMAAWSPDETKLCLTVYPPDWRWDAVSASEGPDDFLRLINNDLFLYDLEEDRVERLTHYTGYDYGGIFSPDGSEIFFISSRAGRGAFYMLNLETREIRQVTNLEPGSYDIPVGRSQTMIWLHQDNSIAYEAQETPYLSTIRTVGADGSNPRNLGIGEQPRPAANGAGLVFLDQEAVPRLRMLEVQEP